MQTFEKEEKSNGSIQFVLKESNKYVRGQYAVQMSYYRGKVYLHLQDNNNGKKASFPDDVFEAMNNPYYTIKRAVEEVRKTNEGPPSPELLVVATRKKRRVVDLEGEDDF
ncbi:uncharacterized protein LOC133180530 [Saccostrea echinata]|uniref:uncharacterized protein LOC133180530 n=1 Tax=Saccostrea echinata TaxID=191078 RepID=UPI002A813404|nr:uncharacterized protein LOC133180530 [Saccostrea echinata]